MTLHRWDEQDWTSSWIVLCSDTMPSPHGILVRPSLVDALRTSSEVKISQLETFA